MKQKLVVVTDLGLFKAYRLEENGQFSKPRLELIEEFSTVTGREPLKDRTTDLAGRFPKAAGAGPAFEMSAGERHNIELEERKRLVKQLAQSIHSLIARQNQPEIYLAAGKEINRLLVDELPRQDRSLVSKNVRANLTKLEKYDMLRHFISLRG